MNCSKQLESLFTCFNNITIGSDLNSRFNESDRVLIVGVGQKLLVRFCPLWPMAWSTNYVMQSEPWASKAATNGKTYKERHWIFNPMRSVVMVQLSANKWSYSLVETMAKGPQTKDCTNPAAAKFTYAAQDYGALTIRPAGRNRRSLRVRAFDTSYWRRSKFAIHPCGFYYIFFY